MLPRNAAATLTDSPFQGSLILVLTNMQTAAAAMNGSTRYLWRK
jgi:hypothetical protein